MSGFSLRARNQLPYGNPEFSDLREKNKIYVDKTSIIYKIARQDTPTFFSRPRRFGKSLLINTLADLFAHGLKNFHGLDIEKDWTDTTYHVVKFDFSRLANKSHLKFKSELNDKIIREFGFKDKVSLTNELGVRDPDSVFDEIASNLQNNATVLLIDEYDAPVTHHLHEPAILKNVISILSDFYAAVKEYTGKFRLIFITGVTRTSHLSIFSGFNNLYDISFDEDFNDLLGFTNADLTSYFDAYIEDASKILNISISELYQRLEDYYDGFKFSLNAEKTVYNPWSILNFLMNPKDGLKNYWFKSSGSSSLVINYLKTADLGNYHDLKDRKLYTSEEKISDRYEITNIPPEIFLLQTGYLTLRKVTDNVAALTFPNTEVEDSILKLYLLSNNLEPDVKFSSEISKLQNYIDKEDISEIVKIFNFILNDCVSILSNIFMDERSIRDIIYAALPQTLGLQKVKERESAKGRSDLELITPKTHLIIEFKRTNPKRNAQRSLAEAVTQMQAKQYGVRASGERKILQVAMIISSEDKLILENFCKKI